MRSRIVSVFILFILTAKGLILHLMTLSVNPRYIQAASSQGTYRVEICKTRGRIYDCKMRTLAGGRLEYKAVIAPSQETTVKLSRVLPAEKIVEIESKLKGKHPFVCTVDDAGADGEGAIVYAAQKRYGKNNMAVHTLGYLDGAGKGVFGIERAFDDYLTEVSGEMTVRFTVDAKGSGLAGIEPELTDTTANSTAGVVLTLDADMQQLVEEAARKYVKKGAIVVTEIETGELKACVSMPAFEQDNVGAYLKSEDAPLVNRITSPYDLGSVFKLVVAAAALESGISPDYTCNCEGSVDIGENTFNCSNRHGHGEVNMEQAIAYSCNMYFIDIAQQIGGDKIFEYAKRFGYGSSIELAQNYLTAAGCVPDKNELQKPAALANISFGQGELLGTPVHVNSVTAAIANKGIYIEPTVFKATVDRGLNTVTQGEKRQGTRVIEEQTAQLLQGFMRAATDYGTAKPGVSERVISAAKTGTAETGMKINGKKVLQTWYTGYFPADATPKYAVTVLVENGEGGGSTCGPVFKYIADMMN